MDEIYQNGKETTMPTRKKKFDPRKEVKAIARERVGTVPSSKVIVSKLRKIEKHKQKLNEETE